MSQGTPQEYEQAIAAEHADIPLDYPGRGKLDVHAATERILAKSLAFEAVITGQPGADTLRRHGSRAIAAHERTERIEIILSNFIQYVGEKLPAPVVQIKDGQSVTVPVNFY